MLSYSPLTLSSSKELQVHLVLLYEHTEFVFDAHIAPLLSNSRTRKYCDLLFGKMTLLYRSQEYYKLMLKYMEHIFQ